MPKRLATTIAELEEIGRTRRLTDAESLQLEWAVRRARRKLQRPWTARDILKLRKLARQRKKWVEMATALDRTPAAVGRMLHKLRDQGKCGYISAPGSTGRYPRKSSKNGEAQAGV